jgi:hypothetical protein
MTSPNHAEQLARLDALRQAGQISEAEYVQHRAAVISLIVQAQQDAPPLPPPGGYPQTPVPYPAPPRKRGKLWPILGGVVALVVLISVVAALAASGSGSSSGFGTTTKGGDAIAPSSGRSGFNPTEPIDTEQPTPSESSPTDSVHLAHVGDVMTIDNDDDDLHLEVTLVAVNRTTLPTDGVSAPQPGYRYFAANFRVKNVGTTVYSDDINNNAKVADSQERQFGAEIVHSITAGPLFPSSFSLPPDGARSGWVVFQVPFQATVTHVQYVTKSGYGGGAQWIVP